MKPDDKTSTYVVWLRTKPYVACKKIGDNVIAKYWVNSNERDTLFTLREQLTPQEKATGKKAKTLLISTEVDNVEILR